MADYYPLISRAVAGLENASGEARRAMYERARTALIAQLRSVDPPLSESDITRERLALEEAVRKVEAEAARRARVDAPPAKSEAKAELARAEAAKSEAARSEAARSEAARSEAARPDASQDEPAMPDRPHAPKPEAQRPQGPRPGDALRGPIPRPVSREGASPSAAAGRGPAAPDPRRPGMPQGRARTTSAQGLRDAVAEADTLGRAAAQANRSARRTFSAVPEPSQLDRLEPGMDTRAPHEDYYNETTGEAVRPQPPRPRSPRPEAAAPRKARRPVGGLIKALALIGVLLVLVGGGVLAWPRLQPLIASFTASPPAQQAQKDASPATRPKIPDRVGQPGSQVAPVAQRAVLYDEDPANPQQGKQFNGTVVWRLDSVPGAANQPPELVIRADVEIPDRKFKMSFSMRRNNDPGLPASHTAELSFQLPPDFEGGAVDNVPGILMKQTEQTRGTPLAGLAVKVTDGFFLIGLSNVETDRQRNVQLMKERAWFDVPMVYASKRRAILAVEKGSPGERAFADAFQAWGQ